MPGAYQQTCMSLDERTFRLESLPEESNTITVYQGTIAAGGMAGRTGGEKRKCLVNIMLLIMSFSFFVS